MFAVNALEDRDADEHPQRVVSIGCYFIVEGASHAARDVPRDLQVEVTVVGKKVVCPTHQNGGKEEEDQDESQPDYFL